MSSRNDFKPPFLCRVVARSSVGGGLLAYAVFLLVPPWVMSIIFDGLQAWLWGLVLFLIVVAIGVIGFRSQGWSFFAKFGEWANSLIEDDSKGNKASSKKKARRPAGVWTSKLIVAVGDQCEFPPCRKSRHLEVHHIDPFAGGGSNRLSNLIVVCPEHHKDFGAGAMNKTRQREYIRRANRFRDSAFPKKWDQGVLLKERQRRTEEEGVVAGW